MAKSRPNYDALVEEGLLLSRRDRISQKIRRSLEASARFHAERGERPPAVIQIRGQLTDGFGAVVQREIAAAWRAPEIRLIVDSPGGLDKVGTAIAKDLKDVNKPIVARGLAFVASAAVRVFAAADRRTARPSTQFCLHRVAIDKEVAGRMTSNRLRKLADKFDRADRGELDWLAARGVRLGASDIENYLAGNNVQMDGKLARFFGLVHDFESDLPYEKRQQELRQQWLRHFGAKASNMPPPGEIW